jgi:uncharacterized repeat protein (TIGR01451 family)
MHRRERWTRIIGVVGIVAGLVVVESAVPLLPTADAVTLGTITTRMEIDGDKLAAAGAVDWTTIFPGGPGSGSTGFVATPGYVGAGFVSAGIVEGSQTIDDPGGLASTCDGTDADASVNGQKLDDNPWEILPDNVNKKSDFCTGGQALEVVQVETSGGGTQTQYILYQYWTREPSATGDLSTFVYLEGPVAGRGDDVLLESNYDPASGTSFNVYRWTGAPEGAGSWQSVGVTGVQVVGVNNDIPGKVGNPGTFGESAINLTTTGILPETTCGVFAATSMFTRTGEGPTATIVDFMQFAAPITIDTCSPFQVSKQTTPAGFASGTNFGYELDQLDAKASHDGTLSGTAQPGGTTVSDTNASPNVIAAQIAAGSTHTWQNVIAQPDYRLAELAPPAGWELAKIECTFWDPFFVDRSVTPPVVSPRSRTIEQSYTGGAVTPPLSPIVIPPTIIDGPNNQVTSCTITNQTSGVSIKKTGTGTAGTIWNFTRSDVPGTPIPLTINGADADFSYASGTTVTFTEPAAPTNNGTPSWTLQNIVCTRSDGSPAGANAVVDLAARAVTVTTLANDVITCDFQNRQNARLTIKKATTGGTGTFTFVGTVLSNSSPITFTNGNGATSSTITTTDAMGAASVDLLTATLPPGGVSISETAATPGSLADWPTTSVACTSLAPFIGKTAVVPLAAGADVTCTFSNTKNGQLVISKATVGGVGTFGINVNGVSRGSITTLTPGTAASGNEVVVDAPAGVYNVTETLPADGLWDQTGATCSNGSPITSVNVAAGEVVACTFTNTKKGTILVEKYSIGGNGTFSFTGDVAGSITTSAGATAPGDRLSKVLVPGTYSVAETVPAGWDLTNTVCSDGSAVSAISLQAGETITCTFTNTKRGQIIVRKATLGGTGTFGFVEVGGAFEFGGGTPNTDTITTTTGASPATASGNTLTAEVIPNVGEGQAAYAVTEDLPDNTWLLSSAGTVCDDSTGLTPSKVDSIRVSPGETVTCTFTNIKRVEIVVAKQTLPDQPTNSTQFGFEGSWVDAFDGTADFTVADDGTSSSGLLNPGVYTIRELVPTGWDLTGLTCTDTNPGVGLGSQSSSFTNTTDATITVNAGDQVTCTYENTQRGTIVIVKNSGVEGGVFDYTGTWAGAGSFTIDTNGQPSNTRAVTFSNVLPGSYQVTEQVEAGFDLKSLVCVETPAPGATADGSSAPSTPARVAGGSIDLDAGETVTCTYSNSRQGTIVIVKDAQGAIGNAAATDFNFGTTGLTPTSFTLDDDGDAALSDTRTFSNLTATEVKGDTYSVTEQPIDGWTLTSITCSGNSYNVVGRTVSVNLGAGQTVSCTYRNTAVPAQVSLTKSVSGVASTFVWPGFTFTLSPAATPGTAQTINGTGNTTSAPVTWTDLVPGQIYTITETPVTGWTSTLTCSGITDIDGVADNTVTFAATAGMQLGCAATNAATPARVSVTKTVSGVDQNYAWSFNFGINPVPAGQTSPKAISGTGNSTGTSAASWTGLIPGTSYTITETTVAGFTSTLTCTGATDTDNTLDSAVTFVATPGTVLSCSATNAAAQASLVVNKTSVGGTGVFNFDIVRPTSADLALSADTGTSNPAATSTASLIPGELVEISEVDPGSSWTKGTLTCTIDPLVGPNVVKNEANGIVSHIPAPGDAISCAITNTKKGTIVVVKNVAGANGTFDFTLTGQQDFSITTSAGSGSKQFDDQAAPGTYTLTEVLAGSRYDGALICSDSIQGGTTSTVSGLVGTIELDPGETVTCTYTNTERGVIIVDKVTVPSGDPTVFDFTLTGDADGFTLTDAANPHNSGLLVPGVYTLAELAESGFSNTDLRCTEGVVSTSTSVAKPTATLTLDPGETITCEYTNARLGDVTVDKKVSSVPTQLSGSSYEVEYEVVVTSESYIDQTFDLEDEILFGDGATVTSATVVAPAGITPVSGWTGLGSTTLLVDDGTIPARTVAAPSTLTFTITVVFTADGSMSSSERDCTISGGESGTGTLNTTAVNVGGLIDTGEDCAVIPDPQIAMTKDVTGAGAVRNSDGTWTISYTLTVENTGDGPGSYTLTDTPQPGAGVTITSRSVSPVNAAWSAGTTDVVATGEIAAGGQSVVTVTLQATVAVTTTPGAGDCTLGQGEVGTGFLNTAEMTPNIGGPVTDTACDTFSTLTLVKNVVNDQGGNATLTAFTLTGAGTGVTVTGTSPATGAVPAGTYVLSETNLPGYVASAWTCTGGTVTGSSVVVTDGADVVCEITNDDDGVDLSLDKSDGGIGVVAGVTGPFPYTITITNVGSRDVDAGEDPVVTDVLPIGFSWVAPAPAGCTISGQTLTCSIPAANLQQGEVVVITATATATAATPAGTYTNRAWVTTADDPAFDPPCPSPFRTQATTASPLNNVDCEDTPVTEQADMAILKSVDVLQPLVGDSVVFTLAVTNLGPTVATGVTVTDNVPATLTVTAVSSSDYTCSASGNSITCTRPSQAVGVTGFITVTARVLESAPPNVDITNIGVVSSQTPDVNPANNQDPEVVTPRAQIVAPPTTTTPPITIPSTGGDAAQLLQVALIALISGLCTVLLARRRRTVEHG